jgi:hypothetical protein
MSDLEDAWRDLGVPPEDNGCIRCSKKVNNDGSDVTWRCAGCNRLVCRECTLCEPRAIHGLSYLIPESDDDPLFEGVADTRWMWLPGAGGTRFLDETLCSLDCWTRVGSPDE